MKITAKQLRMIIREEANNLNEMFTPIGGIGFGDIPRRPRSDYHELTLVDQAYDDLVRESDEVPADEVDEAGSVPLVGASLELRLTTLEKKVNEIVEKLSMSVHTQG
jgi:hypothetical protein